jgi:predicted NACHT family NTPase
MSPTDSRAELPIENDSVARTKYLDSVIREHRAIHFSGMAVIEEQTEVDMARVFVMPRVVFQPTGLAQTLQEEPKAVSTLKLFNRPHPFRRLVILGGPGSGKTTLLEALTLAFAKPEHFQWSRTFPKLLPIFYRVRDLEKDLNEKQNNTIWDCIQFRCSSLGRGSILPPGFFSRQMAMGGLVFFFDGLDETSSPAKRDEIVDLLAGFAEELSPESRFVVSSRPHDYRHRFDGITYAHYDLCEFNNREIQTFIQHWQAIHEPDPSRAKQKAQNLWRALEVSDDILPLARKALLLTMIVRVHFGLRALPNSRLGLYEKCTETLLKHWATDKGLPPSPIDANWKHKLLQRLAYEMQGEAGEHWPRTAGRRPGTGWRMRGKREAKPKSCYQT